MTDSHELAQREPTAPQATGPRSSTATATLAWRLQASAGNHALARMMAARRDADLQRKGFGSDVVELVKDKFFKPEPELDGQLRSGLHRTALVLRAAQTAVEAQEKTEATLRQAAKYGEIASKFEEAEKNADKIIKIKENVQLFLDFKAAWEDAEDVDLSRDGATGAKKLFKLMSAGGKIGKKVFPPPLDSYFDFLSQMKDIENVLRAYEPLRKDEEGHSVHPSWDGIEWDK